jgi:hypothetical protein
MEDPPLSALSTPPPCSVCQCTWALALGHLVVTQGSFVTYQSWYQSQFSVAPELVSIQFSGGVVRCSSFSNFETNRNHVIPRLWRLQSLLIWREGMVKSSMPSITSITSIASSSMPSITSTTTVQWYGSALVCSLVIKHIPSGLSTHPVREGESAAAR